MYKRQTISLKLFDEQYQESTSNVFWSAITKRGQMQHHITWAYELDDLFQIWMILCKYHDLVIPLRKVL